MITQKDLNNETVSSGDQRSWYQKILGRSVFSIIFGNFFEIKNNAAGIIAVVLVFTLSFVVITKIELLNDLDKVVDGVLNVIFVVVGYYFGAKQSTNNSDNDDD